MEDSRTPRSTPVSKRRQPEILRDNRTPRSTPSKWRQPETLRYYGRQQETWSNSRILKETAGDTQILWAIPLCNLLQIMNLTVYKIKLLHVSSCLPGVAPCLLLSPRSVPVVSQECPWLPPLEFWICFMSPVVSHRY